MKYVNKYTYIPEYESQSPPELNIHLRLLNWESNILMVVILWVLV